ncbi:MAG: TerB family tellurite resistance protein, partial [Pseudolabrys sp.]
AVSMFGSLKNLISTLVGDARLKKLEDTDCRLATAALLTRVATVDSEMSEARREKLHAVLKSCFGLDDLTTVELIHDATAADRSAVDLYHFTRQLNDALDNEGRQRIVKMMWQVIYVDERVNEFESTDLLGVSSRQRIELRERVAVDRAALNPI